MNGAMIRRVAFKDWSLHRVPIALFFAAGLASVALLVSGGEGLFYLGTVLLFTVVIGHGIYLAFSSVLKEHTEGTLPFLMSLPISVQEYTAGKLLGNVLMFLLPWGVVSASVLTVILAPAGIPDGLAPFAVLVLVELLVGYFLILGVALVSESMGWTVGAMIFSNIFVHIFMYVTSHLPGIAATMSSDRAAWNDSFAGVLLAELAAIALILLLTWQLQSRKRDFL